MKQLIKIVVYFIVVLVLLIFAWLKSIEVNTLRIENEYLFDKLNLQIESEQNEIGKTRLDRVNEMSSRVLSVPRDLDAILMQVAHLIWDFMSDYDLSTAQLLKINNTNDISVVNSSLPTINDLRYKSYELWKTKDFILTALIYRSSSIDAITGDINPFFVIEIEHEKLTGTYYIFIPSNKIWDESKIETNYVDRN